MANSLDIKVEKIDTTALVGVVGRIDTTTAPQLGEEVTKAMEGTEKLILDFAQVGYISSSGLRVLLSAQKTMNKQGSMVLKNVREEIMEIFDVTGFADILTIE